MIEQLVDGHEAAWTLGERMLSAEFLDRRVFVRELSRNWSRTLEAPSWLWGSLV